MIELRYRRGIGVVAREVLGIAVVRVRRRVSIIGGVHVGILTLLGARAAMVIIRIRWKGRSGSRVGTVAGSAMVGSRGCCRYRCG